MSHGPPCAKPPSMRVAVRKGGEDLHPTLAVPLTGVRQNREWAPGKGVVRREGPSELKICLRVVTGPPYPLKIWLLNLCRPKGFNPPLHRRTTTWGGGRRPISPDLKGCLVWG